MLTAVTTCCFCVVLHVVPVQKACSGIQGSNSHEWKRSMWAYLYLEKTQTKAESYINWVGRMTSYITGCHSLYRIFFPLYLAMTDKWGSLLPRSSGCWEIQEPEIWGREVSSIQSSMTVISIVYEEARSSLLWHWDTQDTLCLGTACPCHCKKELSSGSGSTGVTWGSESQPTQNRW